MSSNSATDPKYNAFIVAFLLFIVGSVSLTLAAPVGNPASPKLLFSDWFFSKSYSPKTGGEIDFVFDGGLEDVNDSELNFYGGMITLTLADKVDIYTTLGVANVEFDKFYDNIELILESKSDFAWCVGSKVLLWQFENGIMVGIDAKYRQAKPDGDKVIIDGTEYQVPSENISSVTIEYKEWQVALGIAYPIGKFVPYGGIKYSDTGAEMSTTVLTKTTLLGTTYTVETSYSSDDINRKDRIGIFLGCDLTLSDDSIALNVEGRLIDEKALNVGATIRF